MRISILLPALLLLLLSSCRKENDFIVTQQKFELVRDIKTDPATGDTIYMICIPTGFSPNGDGVDDQYIVSGTGISADDFSMKIFSRTPDLIFSTTDRFHGWDGRISGQNNYCPQGEFTAEIRVKDSSGELHEYSQKLVMLH